MLTITPTAANVLTDARSEKGAPDDYGVRFFATRTAESDDPRLAFKFVQEPEADDTTLKADDIEAYIAPEVQQLLGDVTIDTEQDGDRVGLVIKRPS